MKIRNLSLVACAALLCSPVFAQGGPFCSAATVAGTYTVSCSGWTAAGPGGALVPIMQVGSVSGDPDNNWIGSTVVNVGGQTVIPDAKVTGKAQVKPDCTGSVAYNKGTPAELNVSFVVNQKDNEIYGLVVDKGSVISCTLKMISKRF